jgi:pimeloyl-ACP methyl ester carboxylesterase
MGLDIAVVDKLGSRLADDVVVAGLPAPGRCRVLMDVGDTRFGVSWDAHHGFDVHVAPDINDAWDFGFTVPASAWDEFVKPIPPPLHNTAQALVARFGDTLIAGDRVKWAQYAPLVERILACLKPTRDRGQVPQLPRKSAITASYLTIDYQDREYRLFYEEAGTGIPMICLHTAGSDSRQYKYLLEDTELQADFRMIAFDMPWHGRSTPPRGWRGERYENDIDWYLGIIRGFTAAMELPEQPVLVGCSMGGSVSLVMSGTHGEDWRAICALEGTLGGNPHAPSRRGVWTRHLEVDHSMFLSTWVAGLMSPDSPQDLQDEVLWEYGQSGPGVYNGDGAMVTSLQRIGPTLTKAKCPLYVFSGDYDYSATPALSRAAAEQLGGQFIPMEGKGHFPMAEDPEGFKRYLMPVLDQIKRA